MLASLQAAFRPSSPVPALSISFCMPVRLQQGPMFCLYSYLTARFRASESAPAAPTSSSVKEEYPITYLKMEVQYLLITYFRVIKNVF